MTRGIGKRMGTLGRARRCLGVVWALWALGVSVGTSYGQFAGTPAETAVPARQVEQPQPCSIQIWFSLLPYDASASLYGKRAADRVSTWLATVQASDQCPERQLITEHDLAFAAAGQNLQIVSITSASLVMIAEQRQNGWRRAGSIITDVALWTAGGALAGSIMGDSGKKALGLALPILGPIGERLIGRAPETVGNHLQLIEQRTLALEPGGAGACHLFSAPYTGDSVTRFATIERK